MSIRKYFTFKGRINRKKYFFYQIAINIGYLIFSVYEPENFFLNILSIILMMILIFVVLSKMVQRLHDINTSGIIILIPAILMIVAELTNIVILGMIVLGFHCHLMIKKGTYGPNKYGHDPLNHTTEYVTLLNEI
ncbi:DUF805 domain-containing protein [Wukongibacter baidiensis]